MKIFFKKLWIALSTPYPEDDYNEPLDHYKASRKKENYDSWCPFCGYNGTADDLRCHLLNDHKP